jgi:hypothetical protein
MKLVIAAAVALSFLAACEQRPAPTPPPPAAPEEKESVELKVDPEAGAVEFKKEGGEGDDVNVEVNE